MVSWLLAQVLLAAHAACGGAVSIWSVGKPAGHVEIRDDLPSPHVFYEDYILNRGGPFDGVGKPVLFRGAAKSMPAYELWTDSYLRERHGEVRMDQVETEKKETRKTYPHEDWSLSKFLDEYDGKDIYSTANTPKGISDEVYVLPSINCGGFHGKLASTVFWFSSGGTKSVVHNDAQQNFHCMFAGQKDWILWRPDARIARRKMGWINAEEEAKFDPSFKDAYGTYAGLLDVDDMDLGRFPGWGDLEWWNMTLRAGDCAYIPQRWYHYVESLPQRSISVHLWFGGSFDFDEESCRALQEKGLNVSEQLFRLSDCTWGWNEPSDSPKKKKKTRCTLPKSPKPRRTNVKTDL